jgi:hypothetical protein
MVQAGTGLAHAVKADPLVKACHGFATLEKAKVAETRSNRILTQGDEHSLSNAAALRARMNSDGSNADDVDRLGANQRLSTTELEVCDEFTGGGAAENSILRDGSPVGGPGKEIGELRKRGDKQISNLRFHS